MNLLGIKVKHKTFGEGEIISCNDSRVSVKFAAKETVFQFPQCFEFFLEVLDEQEKALILKMIDEYNRNKRQTQETEAIQQQSKRKPLKVSPKTPSNRELQSAIIKAHELEGRVYQLNRHADFLNNAFGTHCKKYYQGSWSYSANIIVWMVRFYGRTDGWENRFEGNRITEEYFGDKDVTEPAEPYRIAVSVDDRWYGRTYTVLGLFKISRDESCNRRRIYYKV